MKFMKLGNEGKILWKIIKPFFQKRVGEKMCQLLKELHGKTPECFLNAEMDTPVDIYKILHEHGIKCYRINFKKIQSRLPIKEARLAGMAYAKGNELIFFVSDKSNYRSTRFILAHELGHCCKHISADSSFHLEMYTIPDIVQKVGRPAMVLSNKKEEEADEFARELLIPTKSLLRILRKADNPTINGLAELYQVPPEQVERKLVDLKTALKRSSY